LSDGSESEIGRADTAAETVAGEGAREMQVLCGREEGRGLGTMLTVKYSGVVDGRSIALLLKESGLDMIVVDNNERDR
jgi:hypothetical protein